MGEDTGSSSRQATEEILLKYFTREQVKCFELTEDTATFREAAFSVDRHAGTIHWSAAPYDEFLNGQLTELPRDQATWALVAFIKVRYFDDPAGVIARARSGALYDEDYYTRRGGGSPYLGYPILDSGIDITEHFGLLANEVVARFGKVRVLDAGCATGVFVRALANTGCDAHGVDISEWAVTHAVTHNVVQGSLLGLPHDSASFDLIMSQDVLEHVHPDDLPRVIAEQTRVTRRGGNLVHFVPFYPEYPNPVQVDAHLTNADRAWWERFFESRPNLQVIQTPGEGAQWDYSSGILSRYFVLRVNR